MSLSIYVFAFTINQERKHLMYFAAMSHELFIEKSAIHRGLKAMRTDDGAMLLVGAFRITYSRSKG